MQFDIPLPVGWRWETIEAVQAQEPRPIVTGPFGSAIGSRFFVDQGVPVIRGNNLSTARTRFIDDGFVFLTEEKAAEFKNLEAHPGDLVFTAAGTIGQVGLIPQRPRFPRYIISNKQMRARLDTTVVEPLFAYYWFTEPFVQEHIRSRNTGSTIPLINLSVLRGLPIPVPPIGVQRAVLSIVSPLDDRIDLLRQTNATLECIAQALFKSWFIDFDPVRAKAEGREPDGMDAATAALFPAEFEESALGLIPKGWRSGCLGNVLSQRVSRTKASEETAALPYVPIECITAKSVFLRNSLNGAQAQSSLTLFKQGDILFGAMRPYFHKVCLAPFDGVTRTTAFVLKAEHPAFALFAAFDDSTIEFATTHSEGSTIPYAKWAGSLERKPLVLPPSQVAARFEAIAMPILEAGMQNTHRMQTLSELRDELLPRLISGKLRLPEAQAQLEEAIA